MLARHVAPLLLQALRERPVVLLRGPRQAGKTTLVLQLAQEIGARYLSLDHLTVLAAAKADPAGFLAALPTPLVLDEVQRAPELFPALKAAVDRARRPGSYLLTGSADVMLLPRLARELVGRLEILTLWPFSQGELLGQREGFIEAAFAEKLPAFILEPEKRFAASLLVRGGFPEPCLLLPHNRRSAWFADYLETVVQRDVRDLSEVTKLAELPRLLELVAVHSTGLLNHAELSRRSGLPQTSLKRYLALLLATFLLRLLPPWHSNLGKRLVKSPKLLLVDTGLLTHLLGVGEEQLLLRRELFGQVLENFVAMELEKQVSCSADPPALFFFRTHQGEEVDLVLERRDGKLVGVEVKAAATVGAADFRGLRSLAAACGEAFHRGLLLYLGSELVPFGEKLFAVPLEALWSWGAAP